MKIYPKKRSMPDWSPLHPFAITVEEHAIRQLATNGRLVAHRRDGIFARLLCFANAIRLSRKFGLQNPTLIWNRVPAGDNKRHGYDENINRTIELPDLVEMNCSADLQRVGPLFSSNRPCVLEGENTDEAINELSEILRSFRLQPVSQAILEAVVEKIGYQAGECIGIHLRSGDTDNRLEWFSTKSYPLSIWRMVLASLQRESNTPQIVIASNRSEPSMFRSPNVKILSEIMQQIGPLGTVQEDYISNLALASLPRLIGCRLSAFSMHAALYAGRPAEEPLHLLPEDMQAVIKDLLRAAVNSHSLQADRLMTMIDEGGLAPQLRERLRINKLLLGITREIPLLIADIASANP